MRSVWFLPVLVRQKEIRTLADHMFLKKIICNELDRDVEGVLLSAPSGFGVGSSNTFINVARDARIQRMAAAVRSAQELKVAHPQYTIKPKGKENGSAAVNHTPIVVVVGDEIAIRHRIKGVIDLFELLICHRILCKWFSTPFFQ